MKSIEKNFQFIKTVILPSLLGAGLMTLAVILWTSTEDPIALHAVEPHLQTNGEAFVVIVQGDRTLVRPLEEVLDELLQAQSASDSAVMAAVLRSSKPDGILHSGMTGIKL